MPSEMIITKDGQILMLEAHTQMLAEQLEASQKEVEVLKDAAYEATVQLSSDNEEISAMLAKIDCESKIMIQNNTKLRQQLEASQETLELIHAIKRDLMRQLGEEKKLSEERRVALERCTPHYHDLPCDFCGYDPRIHDDHEPNCDYVRLCKKD